MNYASAPKSHTLSALDARSHVTARNEDGGGRAIQASLLHDSGEGLGTCWADLTVTNLQKKKKSSFYRASW